VAALHYLWSLKWSVVAGVAAAALSFLSFGLLGYVLYYAAYPVVGLVFPPLSAWRPDTVWPLIVGAGIVWSLSFLPAGVLDRAWRRAAWPRAGAAWPTSWCCGPAR